MLKIFENFSFKSELEKWAYGYAKYNHAGHNSYEDAKWHLDAFFDKEIDYLLNEPIILKRVLKVESEEDIDKEKLGIHYLDPNYSYRLKEKDWFDSIGIEISDNEKLFLVTVSTKKSNIDFEAIIQNILTFPNEFEITLKDPYAIKILDIEEINYPK